MLTRRISQARRLSNQILPLSKIDRLVYVLIRKKLDYVVIGVALVSLAVISTLAQPQDPDAGGT